MLVLSRKRRENIKIGDGITLTVLWVAEDYVRLGIEAPHNTSVATVSAPRQGGVKSRRGIVTVAPPAEEAL